MTITCSTQTQVRCLIRPLARSTAAQCRRAHSCQPLSHLEALVAEPLLGLGGPVGAQAGGRNNDDLHAEQCCTYFSCRCLARLSLTMVKVIMWRLWPNPEPGYREAAPCPRRGGPPALAPAPSTPATAPGAFSCTIDGAHFAVSPKSEPLAIGLLLLPHARAATKCSACMQAKVPASIQNKTLKAHPRPISSARMAPRRLASRSPMVHSYRNLTPSRW